METVSKVSQLLTLAMQGSTCTLQGLKEKTRILACPLDERLSNFTCPGQLFFPQLKGNGQGKIRGKSFFDQAKLMKFYFKSEKNGLFEEKSGKLTEKNLTQLL